MNETVLQNWQPHWASLFGRHTIHGHHTLHTGPYFSDAALADLIETAPKSHYHLHTMKPDGHDLSTWREGEIGDASGERVLQAIYAGQLWFQLRRVHEFHPRYGRLLADIFAEFEARVPGLKTFKRDLSILISSPGSHVFYHSDVPGQMLWQVRGHKTVYIYPPRDPFLPSEAIENIVLNQVEEDGVDYHPWFDEYAEVYELQPGRFLHWDLNGPHRIVNGDCVNVSVTTEHFTPEIRRIYAMNYGNGLLRRYAGFKSLSAQTSGPVFWAKALLAAVHKFSGVQHKVANERRIEFKIDPNAPQGFIPITPRIQTI
ncbi:MAG: hypothetical protein AAGF59_05140 [Pseudomonadota bacterium]